MDTLRSEYLCDMSVDLETPQRFGATPHGTRVIVYAKSGQVDGPNIKGKVLPGGGDWLVVRPDSASELDVRGTIQTDDGHLIYMHWRGIMHARRSGSVCSRANVTSTRLCTTTGSLRCSRRRQRNIPGSIGSSPLASASVRLQASVTASTPSSDW